VVAFLTVLGFLTVVLIGPVIALIIGILSLMAGVLIATAPFALVGLLVWGIFLAASPDRRQTWRNLRTRVAAAWHWIVDVPVAACVRLCAWGVGVGRTVMPKAVPVARQAGEVALDGIQVGMVLAERGANAARPAAHFVGTLFLEMIGGAAVGVILVCLIDSHVPGGILGLRLLGGALGGACLGLLVGAARSSVSAQRS
jgi:hypothetical protein